MVSIGVNVLLLIEMDHVYSKEELTDMLLVYIEARQNSLAASSLYAQPFSNTHLPLQKIALEIYLDLNREEECYRDRQECIHNSTLDVLNWVEKNNPCCYIKRPILT